MVALGSGGAMPRQAVAVADEVVPMPPGFSFAEAATFRVGHLTAYHALKTRADLKGRPDAARAPGRRRRWLGLGADRQGAGRA